MRQKPIQGLLLLVVSEVGKVEVCAKHGCCQQNSALVQIRKRGPLLADSSLGKEALAELRSHTVVQGANCTASPISPMYEYVWVECISTLSRRWRVGSRTRRLGGGCPRPLLETLIIQFFVLSCKADLPFSQVLSGGVY